jgi:hypothetical protein
MIAAPTRGRLFHLPLKGRRDNALYNVYSNCTDVYKSDPAVVRSWTSKDLLSFYDDVCPYYRRSEYDPT